MDIEKKTEKEIRTLTEEYKNGLIKPNEFITKNIEIIENYKNNCKNISLVKLIQINKQLQFLKLCKTMIK